MNVLPYLDPSSGSMLLQIILGGAAAVAVGAKFYWRRLLETLRIRKPDTASRDRLHPGGADDDVGDAERVRP